MIVLEYVFGGSLAHLLYDYEKSVSLEKMFQFAEQSAQGIYHLHSQTQPIIHRDIAARNVLLTNDHHCKITGEHAHTRLCLRVLSVRFRVGSRDRSKRRIRLHDWRRRSCALDGPRIIERSKVQHEI